MSFITSLGDWLRKVSRSFSDVSINGRNIVLTRHNGDTETIITQDTDTTYNNATQSADGLMSVNDKTKLDGITAGAEPNQNAFSNVKVGSTTVAADVKTDTLELVAGNNITLTPDAANDKVTIAATDTVYTHPATSGNKHIPSGGSSGQILRWSDDGTAVWGADNDTVTTVSASGSGNAVTSITASNGALTVKKDSTFSLSGHTHPDLPLSGGTMTGNIHFANTQTAPTLSADNISTYFRMFFNSFENGGSIYLYGKNHSDADLAGGFSLFAHNGTTYKILRGLPDGRLSWDDHGLAPTPKTSSIGQWSRVWVTTSYSLPSGGTWAYVIVALNSSNSIWGMWADIKAGGTSIANNSNIARIYGFVWRIA